MSDMYVPCRDDKACGLCCCFMQTMIMMNKMLMATESPNKAARVDLIKVVHVVNKSMLIRKFS